MDREEAYRMLCMIKEACAARDGCTGCEFSIWEKNAGYCIFELPMYLPYEWKLEKWYEKDVQDAINDTGDSKSVGNISSILIHSQEEKGRRGG